MSITKHPRGGLGFEANARDEDVGSDEARTTAATPDDLIQAAWTRDLRPTLPCRGSRAPKS
jgi:hypothetical protein